MKPADTAAARQTLGLSAPDFALMLGYSGEQRRQMTYDLESGRRELQEPQRRLLAAYLAGYRPPDWPS